MEYNWTQKNLKEDRKILIKMLEKEQNPIKREEIYHAISWVSGCLFDTSDESLSFTTFFQLQKDYDYYGLYYEITKRFYQLMSFAEREEPSLILKEDKIFPTLKKEDTFELIDEFSKTLPEEYRKNIKQILEQRQKFIRFRTCQENSYMTYIPIINHCYFSILQDKKITAFHLLSMTHEFAHGVSAFMNPYRYINEDIILTEIETYFTELISADFYAKELNHFDFYDISLDELVSDILDANTVIQNKKLLNLFLRKHPHDSENFEKFKLENEMDPYFDVVSEYSYIISYLVAVELYMIYQENPSLAFEKLTNIIQKTTTQNETQVILEEVNPTEHIKQYYKKLSQKFIKNV